MITKKQTSKGKWYQKLEGKKEKEVRFQYKSRNKNSDTQREMQKWIEEENKENKQEKGDDESNFDLHKWEKKSKQLVGSKDSGNPIE